MKTVVLATNNAHKASEISSALAFPGWEFKTLRELGIASDPAEDADTFEGNARIKARAAREEARRAFGESVAIAALADDSGLVVDALGGAPGVYSARYASDDGRDADDEANNRRLLHELEGVPDGKRTARFASTLVFIDEDGAETVSHGAIEGRIGHAGRGENGFGYDPLFWPSVFDFTCTLAEVPLSRKNEVSHRGNALRDLRAKLEAKRS